MDTFAGNLVAGLSTGSLYALIAVGLWLVLSAAGVIDFARGQLVLLAALLSFSLQTSHGAALAVAVVVCVGAVAAVGGVEQLAAVAPLRGDARTAGWLVSTLGFGIVVQALTTMGVGPGTHFPPGILGSSFSLGGVALSGDRLLAMGAAPAVVLATWLALRHTEAGRCLRAVSEDREAAALRGIDVRLYAVGAFVVAGAVAAIAGLLVGPILRPQIELATLFTIRGFVALVIGGTGSVWGALAGGAVLGLAEQLGGAALGGNTQNLIGLGVLLLVLLVRPEGLFASRRLRLA